MELLLQASGTKNHARRLDRLRRQGLRIFPRNDQGKCVNAVGLRGARTVLLQTRLKSRASACGGLWSGGELEQFSDEGCLSLHVAAADLPNLPLPHHRHRLVASQGSSGGSEAGEAEPRPGQAFDPPMVLFRDVVQVLALP